jgi:glycosyltransferase involved in cell wall biosynthesis
MRLLIATDAWESQVNGVGHSNFRPVAPISELSHLPRPLFLSVGRLAPEKNL